MTMSLSTPQPIQLSVSALAGGKALIHHWNNCVGAGRAQEGLRANWQEQLRMAVSHCGFRYLRFHGIFHDDMCVYKEVLGRAVYNWQYVDDLFDRMLEIGIRPFVELGFFPTDIAAPNSKTQFWWKGNITPPDNFVRWGNLIEAFVTHCLQRYGNDEVRRWYFEVWNEPNLYQAFWDGTRSQYFEMYKVSVQRIKKIDPNLRVGGPATSNFVPDERFDSEIEDTTKQLTFGMLDLGAGSWRGVWIESFLSYCAEHSLPLDFISCHPYPTDFPLDTGGIHRPRTRPANSTHTDLLWLRKVVAASSFPGAEIHLTEWSSSPSPRDHSHDSLPAATFIVRANLESTGLVDSLAYWVFTDIFEEGGAGETVFHGGFGLINFQGIAKPTFHAYRLLKQLGDLELGRTDGAIITRNKSDKMIRALFYHYPAELRDAPPLCPTSDGAEEILRLGEPREIRIEIQDVPPQTTFVLETLDSKHGFFGPVWKDMGSPDCLSRQQAATLRDAAWDLDRKIFKADSSGTLRLFEKVEPWSIALLSQT